MKHIFSSKKEYSIYLGCVAEANGEIPYSKRPAEPYRCLIDTRGISEPVSTQREYNIMISRKYLPYCISHEHHGICNRDYDTIIHLDNPFPDDILGDERYTYNDRGFLYGDSCPPYSMAAWSPSALTRKYVSTYSRRLIELENLLTGKDRELWRKQFRTDLLH